MRGQLHKGSCAEQRFEKENKGSLIFDAEAYDNEIAPKATWQKGLCAAPLLFFSMTGQFSHDLIVLVRKSKTQEKQLCSSEFEKRRRC